MCACFREPVVALLSLLLVACIRCQTQLPLEGAASVTRERHSSTFAHHQLVLINVWATLTRRERRENLEPDFLPYMSKRYSVSELYSLLELLGKGRPQKYLFMVVLRGNSVATLPLAAKPMSLTLSRVRGQHGAAHACTHAAQPTRTVRRAQVLYYT